MSKDDRLKVRSIFLSSQTRQTHSWLFHLAALASVCCPEIPATRIFCLARKTELKSINLYDIVATGNAHHTIKEMIRHSTMEKNAYDPL